MTATGKGCVSFVATCPKCGERNPARLAECRRCDTRLYPSFNELVDARTDLQREAA